MTSAVDRGKEIAGEVTGSRPVRAYQRYGRMRGGVIAGGMAYIGLFSIVAILLLGFTVLGLTLSGNRELQDTVIEQIDIQLPGLLAVGDDPGPVDPAELLAAENALTITGAIALVAALLSGLGWLDAVREGIRAMFGMPTDDRFVVRKKGLDVVILATLGLAIVASAVLSVVVNAATGFVLGLVGLEDSTVGTVLLRVAGIAVVLVADTLIFVILFRLLSALDLPWSQVRQGALIGAVGLGILKFFAGFLLGRVGGNNPLLAASATVVGLLVWLNLVSRLTLLSASFVAERREELVPRPLPEDRGLRELPVAAGPRHVLEPSFGQRATDRTTLAAGAVLGVLAVGSLRALTGAARSAVGLARRD